MRKYCSQVNKFLGIDGGGNCLCGPYLPNSMVRLGPDTIYPQDSSGYCSNHPITCFSHTHVSGTGGGSRYGNIGITPYVGYMRLGIDPYEKEDEQADPGYYSVMLKPAGIKAELTVTPHVGVHRYTFPADQQANLLIDAGSVIRVFPYSDGQGGHCIGGFLEVLNNKQIMGRSDCKGGWGHDFPYSVYFFAELDTPFSESMCADNEGFYNANKVDGAGCKVALRFQDTKQVGLKVGISFVSIANARYSLENEAQNFTFEEIHDKACDIWEETLSKIQVEGGSEVHTRIFYSLFTRLMWGPTDLGTTENPYWRSDVRNFTDYYAIWDSVRNANSLISLFDPKLEADMLNCLLDVADHVGWLPDAWVAGHGAMIQGGSSSDVLFCEAKQKGIEGIDYEKALKYMRKNNEIESPNPWLYGRYLQDYRDKGYVSTNVSHARVSRHIEYAYQDWCIGKLAEALGYMDVAEKNYKSCKKLWNLWRDDIKLFAPKKPDGKFDPTFDPDYVRPDFWNDSNFYEGSAWQWMYATHHDFAGLIERNGGAEAFIERLDRFFNEGHYHSKETMLHIPYLYTYAGRPDKTADRVRKCIDMYFRDSRNGISDNEDMGCQSAFYMCSGMGVYPIMGQDLYMLSSPIFKKTTLIMGDSGNTLVIEAPNADQDHRYIVGASINGRTLDRAWITHSEIADGAVLKLELGKEPNDWGKGYVPPCPAKMI